MVEDDLMMSLLTDRVYNLVCRLVLMLRFVLPVIESALLLKIRTCQKS